MTSQNTKVDTDSSEAPAKGVGCGALFRHFTVHWETLHVSGFSPVQAASRRDARRKYLDQHPASTITEVHEGPVIFKFKYA